MPPPPLPLEALPPDRRQFLATMLDILVRQLAWPEDAEWEAPGGDEPDPDDDVAIQRQLRTVSASLTLLISDVPLVH
jgi:exportin-T